MMAKLNKKIVGNPSGKVGDVVFRNLNGKTFAIPFKGSNKISNSPACVNNRKRFASAIAFSKLVNSFPDLNKIWRTSSLPGYTGFNKIMKINLPLFVNNLPTVHNVISPPGFNIKIDNFSFFPQLLSVDFTPSKTFNKTFIVNIIIFLFEPHNKKYIPPFIFIPKTLELSDITKSISSSFALSLSTDDSRIISKYSKSIIYFSLSHTTSASFIFSDSTSLLSSII